MAYVRTRGNQLLIVHGVRDPKTKKVEQKILFTLYSQAEAKAVLGEGPKFSYSFERLLEHEYPDLSFDWKAIKETIAHEMEVLPDTYDPFGARVVTGFRRDLVAFTRQLALSDPQTLLPAAELIKAHRAELEVLVDLLGFRIKLSNQKPHEFNQDNIFYWRSALRGSEVPPEAEEFACAYYEKGDLDHAEAAFRMLAEAFPSYAEGWNYLGLIELQRERPKHAVEHFVRTIEIAKTCFPTKLAKRHYWNDLRTRPYMRGLRNLALTLVRLGRFDEARKHVDRLDRQCGDDLTASSYRASICLNTEEWKAAADEALRLREVFPAEDFVAAFALFEMGAKNEARASFLHAALHHPRGARLLADIREKSRPNGREIEDHNAGVGVFQMLPRYFKGPKRSSVRFYRAFLEHPSIAMLLTEMAELGTRWSGPTADRKSFERMTEMRKTSFAEGVVDDLFGGGSKRERAAATIH